MDRQVASRSSEVNFTKNYTLLYLFSFLPVSKASVVLRLDPDDAGHFTRDWHGPGTMASSWQRTHATDATTYYRDVLLGWIYAAFSFVEHLLRLAILVHRNVHHLFLSVTRHFPRSISRLVHSVNLHGRNGIISKIHYIQLLFYNRNVCDSRFS